MSADDNAPEQAREVEVVARAIAARWDEPWTSESHLEAAEHLADAALAALAPIRAAERQEAAREAAERAWDEGQAVGYADGHSRNGNGRGLQAIGNPYRADGVTGRSGT